MTVEYVPGLAGVPATRSIIGLIDGQQGELFYRGYPIETLAKNCCFEEVAYLLLKGALPTQGELDGFHGETVGVVMLLVFQRQVRLQDMDKLGLRPFAYKVC